MATPIAGLIRVSTPGQAADDRASVPAQRAAILRICQQHGLEWVRTIQYDDVSGASVLQAPEIHELIRLMRSGVVRGVAAREFSRLMRPENFGDFALLQEFADTSTILYLPSGPIDFTSKSGRLLGGIQAMMAGHERMEILERVWGAKEEKRKRGELAQGKIVLPFGVDYEKGRGFYYTPSAELVRVAALEFLSGNQNYAQLAKPLGVTPRGMYCILRNPILMGRRLIDKKRDISPGGKYPRKDGRQADRRKIARSTEEVISLQVIEKPLLTPQEFGALQVAMDLKRQNHWRTRPAYEHRFVYNGFLVCSLCGEVIHTALARRDYYACRGRRLKHNDCQATYMARPKLEAILDGVFTNQLTSRSFVESCVEELGRRSDERCAAFDRESLQNELAGLRAERSRTMHLYTKGLINEAELEKSLQPIDGSIRGAERALSRCAVTESVDVAALMEAFSYLGEWEFWDRDQKRRLLTTLVPEIRVANYEVQSLGLNPAMFSNEDSRTGRGSWRRRA